jgi:hypothetical protein
VPDWDEDACYEAEQQARELEVHDLDAASDMRAMVQAARRKLGLQSHQAREPYDPSKLKARMAKYYGWSYSEIDQMHFVEFFAAVREANVMIEEEKREYERSRRGEPSQLQGMFQEAEQYQGETVAI